MLARVEYAAAVRERDDADAEDPDPGTVPENEDDDEEDDDPFACAWCTMQLRSTHEDRGDRSVNVGVISCCERLLPLALVLFPPSLAVVPAVPRERADATSLSSFSRSLAA